MCQYGFPALSLLQKRREAANDANFERGMAIIEAIDAARWAHEERTGCHCWREAIEDNPNPLVKTEAA